jgi:Ala-tRNA(Pro) deacylase
MELFDKVAETLAQLEIEYELVEHEPALTTEQADSFIEGIEGVRTKTMFLTNKKKTQYYLLIMDDQKMLDMERFKDLVAANRIRMASSDSLFEKMQLPPGVVSPFGLLNNPEKDILVYFDKEIMEEDRMSFHPNTNEKTIFLKTADLLRFLDEIGFTYDILDL